MKKQPNRTGQLHIQVIGSDRASQPCGIRAAPPHLPVDLWLLPGETVHQLVHRALQTAVGQGLVVTRLLYAEDVAHGPPLLGPPADLQCGCQRSAESR